MIKTVEKVIRLNEEFHLRVQGVQPCGLKFKKEDLEEIYKILYVHQQNIENINYPLKQGMKLVDLGCWTGMISLLMNEVRGEYNGLVYAVDWFTRDDNAQIREISRYINVEKVLEDNLSYYGARETIKIINKKSEEASNLFENNSIDVLFMNFPNKYQRFADNIKYWYKKVKKDGIIIGYGIDTLDLDGIKDIEDVEKSNPFGINLGLIKAIKEQLPDAIKTPKGSIWYCYKKENTCEEECLQ